jgi:hypothetical protein
MVEPTPMQLTTDGVYKTVDGRVWIPNDATDVQLRTCIVAHAGLGGYRCTRPIRRPSPLSFAGIPCKRMLSNFATPA